MVGEIQRLSGELELLSLITLLGVLPILLVTVTTFTRNVIVLSFLRHALGLQQSPPNILLIVLALVLTFYGMFPVFKTSYVEGVKPYLAKELNAEEAMVVAWKPIRSFMISQTPEKDILFFYEMSDSTLPEDVDGVSEQYLLPAFLLGELKLAFKIGFIIFLPFLLIDLVVAAMLTSLGMIMVPPITISLPLKVMLFVVIDGWTLISEVLLKSVV